MLSSFVTVLEKNERNLSLIALSGLMYLSGDLIMTFNWYLYNLQTYTVVTFVKTATHILNFAPKYWLAG